MNLRYSAGVGFFKQRVIGVIVLAVLSSLPLTRTLCEALCGAPATAAGDTAPSGTHCAPTAGDTSVDAGRDCAVHLAGTALLPAIVPATAPMPAAPDVSTIVPVAHSSRLAAWPADVRGGGPPDVAAPARTPTILRI